MFWRTICSQLTLVLLASFSIESKSLSRPEERGLNDVSGDNGLFPKDGQIEPKMILLTPFPSPQNKGSLLLQEEKTDVASEMALFPRMVNQQSAKMTSRQVMSKIPSYEKCLAAAKNMLAKVKKRGEMGGVIPGDLVNEQSIKMHNYLRRRHGAPPLKFDQSMMNIAQEWAAHLACTSTFDHNMSNVEKGIGENMYSIETGHRMASLPMDEVVKTWYEEYKFYTYGWDPEDPKIDAKSHLFGHFTQVVWKGSRLVGCATANPGNKWIVVCNYYPGGNVYSQYAENVLPVRPLYRVADPMRSNVNQLINKWKGKKPDTTKEAFKKMRAEMFDRGDGAMGSNTVIPVSKTKGVAKGKGSVPQILLDAYPDGIPDRLGVKVVN